MRPLPPQEGLLFNSHCKNTKARTKSFFHARQEIIIKQKPGGMKLKKERANAGQGRCMHPSSD